MDQAFGMRVFQAVAELHHEVDERVPTYGAVPNQPFIQGPPVNVFNKDPRAVLDIPERNSTPQYWDENRCLSMSQPLSRTKPDLLNVTQPMEQGFHRHHDIPAAVAIR
jgi:hypothetical protein